MMSMTLQGGMGNQLFQYACARAFSLRTGREVMFNDSILGTDPCTSKCRSIIGHHACSRMYSLGLYRGVKVSFIRDNFQVRYETEYNRYNPSDLDNLPDNVRLQGYWQHPAYFQDAESTLREELVCKNPVSPRAKKMAQLIGEAGDKSVILSIRRGDYTWIGWTLPNEFYTQAINIVVSKVKNPHFFISTDDPVWAKENMKLPYDFTIFDDYERSIHHRLGREDEELWLHSLCKHAVLANSSFSWWGAWLNPDKDRVVVVPKEWLSHDGTGNYREWTDLFLPGWIAIPSGLSIKGGPPSVQSPVVKPARSIRTFQRHICRR